MRNLTTLKTTGQQRVAALVADIGEVLAGHTDAGRPGALQTINEVPLLFRHQPRLATGSYVLVLVGGVGSRRKNGRIGRSNNRSVATPLRHERIYCVLAAITAVPTTVFWRDAFQKNRYWNDVLQNHRLCPNQRRRRHQADTWT